MRIEYTPDGKVRWGAAPFVDACAAPRAPGKAVSTTTAAERRALIASLTMCPGVQRALEHESRLPLQPGAESRFMLAEGAEVKGIVIMLHGFSAGPWQYDELLPLFARNGFHCYAPRLVGHGFKNADESADSQDLPGPGEQGRYRAFADDVHRQVSSLGVPIHVIGLSGGGAIALDLAIRHGDVRRAALLDPFFAPGASWAAGMLRLVGRLDRWSFGHVGQRLRRLPVVLHIAKQDREEWGRPGHCQVHIGQMYALTAFGQSVLKTRARHPLFLQIISTAAEEVVSRKCLQILYRTYGDQGRNGWWDFPRHEDVPHAMISWRENPRAAARAQVVDMLRAFIERGERCTRLPSST